MLFNSFVFGIFLPIVFFLYWFTFRNSLKLQNLFLVIVSYIFYGWWDWRFLGLIILSSALDYWSALMIGNNKQKRKVSVNILGTLFTITPKFFLWLSICTNLGLLSLFKYYNFFVDSAVELLSHLGFTINSYSLEIILPVGISFYTFQTMSYTLDVYRGVIKPTRDPVAFFAYVSFFPQLVAGPIERASNLLPQFFRQRKFSYDQGVEAMRLILWGFFKKVVVADNCAIVVNQVFGDYNHASGLELVMGAVLFAFQIYGDFSGYSDIARGTAKLMGFELMVNFRAPYFSRDIAEFWRRWHISLSTWFRDYLYIPLGGSHGSGKKVIRNIFIIFLVSGLWHGANWTFIIWGALNAVYFLPLYITGKNRVHTDTVAQHKILPTRNELLHVFITFFLTCFAWIFFRSLTVSDAFGYLSAMITNDFFVDGIISDFVLPVVLVILLVVLEWFMRMFPSPLLFKQRTVRYGIYILLIGLILFYGAFINPQSFIYFQF